jgi:hypothetical protein
MRDIIDRTALCKLFEERFLYLKGASEQPLSGGRVLIDREIQTGAIIAKEFLGHVGKAPTIEAKPVVHGEWQQDYRIEKIQYSCGDVETFKLPYGYRCSICSRRIKVKENFCPNCGADMRERIET